MRSFLRFLDRVAGAFLGVFLFPIISILIGVAVWAILSVAAAIKLLNIPFQLIKAFFDDEGLSWRKTGQLGLMLGMSIIEMSALFFLWPLAKAFLEFESTWLRPILGGVAGAEKGISGILTGQFSFNSLSISYSIGKTTGLLTQEHWDLYGQLTNKLTLRLLGRPALRSILPFHDMVAEFPVPNQHPLFETLQIPNQANNTMPLTAVELRQAESLAECSRDLLRYRSLHARLIEVSRREILPDAQRPRDELFPEAQAITRPILLFKEVQINNDEWQVIVGSTHITEHQNITHYLINHDQHPRDRQNIFAPPDHEGRTTRYCWHEYTNYSKELEQLKTKIRQAIAAGAALRPEAHDYLEQIPIQQRLGFFDRAQAHEIEHEAAVLVPQLN